MEDGFEKYGFPDGKRYNSFVGYFKRKYGERLQKIVLDADIDFTTPYLFNKHSNLYPTNGVLSWQRF